MKCSLASIWFGQIKVNFSTKSWSSNEQVFTAHIILVDSGRK